MNTKRFLSNVTQWSEGCWDWTGTITSEGYGLYNNRKAHRIMLELVLGRPLKEGMFALHTCDNKLCVNPDHLYEGTRSNNIQDYLARVGRKLKSADIPTIRERHTSGESMQAIADSYKVDRTTISSVINGKTWALA